MKIITVFLCAELSSFISAFPDTRTQTVVHNYNSSSLRKDISGSGVQAVSYSSFQRSASKANPSLLFLTPERANMYKHVLQSTLSNNYTGQSRIHANSTHVVGTNSSALSNSSRTENKGKTSETGKTASNVTNNHSVKDKMVPEKEAKKESASGKNGKKSEVSGSVSKKVNFSPMVEVVHPGKARVAPRGVELQVAGSDVSTLAVPPGGSHGQEKVRTVIVHKHIPYPVKVPVPIYVRRPYPIPVYTTVPYPVKKRVPYYIEKHVHHHPVTVRTPVRHVMVPVARPIPMPVTKVRPIRVPYPVYVEKKVPVYMHRQKATTLPVKSATTGVKEVGLYHGPSTHSLATYASGYGGRYFPVRSAAKFVNFGKNKVAIFGGHQPQALSTVSTASVKLPDLSYIESVGHELGSDLKNHPSYGYEVTEEHADASTGHVSVLESPLVADLKNLEGSTTSPHHSTRDQGSIFRYSPIFTMPDTKVLDFSTRNPQSLSTEFIPVFKTPFNHQNTNLKYFDAETKSTYAESADHFSFLRPPVIRDISEFNFYGAITKTPLHDSKDNFAVNLPSAQFETDTKLSDSSPKETRYSSLQSERPNFQGTTHKSTLFDSKFGELQVLSLNVDGIKPIGGYGTVGKSITFVSPGLLGKS